MNTIAFLVEGDTSILAVLSYFYEKKDTVKLKEAGKSTLYCHFEFRLPITHRKKKNSWISYGDCPKTNQLLL